MSTVEVKTVQLEEISYTDDLIIDVRSPKEYAEYRIPNAVNIPLFSNEERAKVGTYYKQKGKEAAVDLGMELFGPKVASIFQKVKSLIKENSNRRVIIYCWRGGMRSKTVTGMLGLVGINSYQLVGGIRTFRQYVQQQLEREAEQERRFIVIEGHTGTGKTELLHRLAKEGYPVLDLEGLQAIAALFLVILVYNLEVKSNLSMS